MQLHSAPRRPVLQTPRRPVLRAPLSTALRGCCAVEEMIFFIMLLIMTFISRQRQSEAIARSQYGTKLFPKTPFAASFTTCLRCLSHGARQQVRLHSGQHAALAGGSSFWNLSFPVSTANPLRFFVVVVV